MPKPKPPTKWELFAKAKGIQKKVREKRVWDEEKQEWVNKWGKDGKNKQAEEQWITEVPLNAGMVLSKLMLLGISLIFPHIAEVDYDPRKVARDSRKARIAKNEKQRLQNIARTNASNNTTSPNPHPRDARKKEIERTLATTRISTASMGKFDKQLEGEKKLRGVKRKV